MNIPAEHVANNLEAAKAALTHFLESLDRSGFKDGSEPYQKMANVLSAQCMWSCEKEDSQIVMNQFHSLVHLAQQIHSHLFPYLKVMEQIGSLQDMLPILDELQLSDLAKQVIVILQERKKPCSFSYLRAQLKVPSTKLRAELASLVKEQKISQVKQASRTLYGLGDSVRS